MVALDIGSGVETFRAVVDGSVVGEAAGERLAEMVDGGVVPLARRTCQIVSNSIKVVVLKND